MSIKFQDFNLNLDLVAPVIYKNFPHQVTRTGVQIDQDIVSELGRFLREYNSFLGICTTAPYYRIDAYFDEQSLWILEVNAAFVDGWGVALNLARASAIAVDVDKLVFPKQFHTLEGQYVPELKLFVSELSALGYRDNKIVKQIPENSTESVYIYGRQSSQNYWAVPFDGTYRDNKQHLGEFSRTWESEFVNIPRHYLCGSDSWESIPEDAVLKFCDKGSEECKRARQSVFIGKPSGGNPFFRNCYQEGKLLAQQFVEPMRNEGKNTQLIIMVRGADPLVGYVQYSSSQIINDNSVHGPLLLK